MLILATIIVAFSFNQSAQATVLASAVTITVNGGSVTAIQTYTDDTTAPAGTSSTDSTAIRKFSIIDPVTVTVIVPDGKVFTGWTGDTNCGTSLTCTFVKVVNYDPNTAISTPKEYVTALTFSDISAPAPTPTPTPTPTPAPAPVVTPKIEETKPVAPEVSEVAVNRTSPTSTKPLAYALGEKITFSGKTTPNAKVHLYIHSNPREAEVTADTTGNWSYSISDLEAGDHSVYTVATDTATGLSSEKQLLANFSVAKAQDTSTAPQGASGTSKSKGAPAWLLPVIVGGVVVLTLTAGAGYFIYRNVAKRKAQKTADSNTLIV